MLFKKQLIERIKKHGPLSIADYMTACLYDPEHGFYMAGSSIGEHFITAPEISQTFGEALAIWAILQWQDLGSPRKITMLELGPGRGTLCSDILRCWHRILKDRVEVTYSLCEISPHLKTLQRENLKDAPFPINWVGTEQDWPHTPTLIFANEFFDALPIHQYENHGDQWVERVVTVNHGELAWGHETDFSYQPAAFPQQNDFYEVSPSSLGWAEKIAHHLSDYTGAALIIDYGYTQPDYKDTLQALCHHKKVPILESPGEADLTAHVDFTALTRVFQGFPMLSYVAPLAQRFFLQQHGIIERLQALCEGKTPEQQTALARGVHRLMAVEEMGGLFNVLSIKGKKNGTLPTIETF